MKTIYIRGGKGSNTAIKVMMHHFEELGHPVVRDKESKSDAILSWGCSYDGPKPCVNGHVNQYNKFNCFNEFRKAGVLCPETFSLDAIPRPMKGGEVWLARKRQHQKGKDITVCHNANDVRIVQQRGEHSFISVYVPIDTEYRVWVFKGKAFSTYEKVFKGVGEYEGFMRNRRFGFSFQKRDDLIGSHQIEGPCIKAVAALRMDWGAVDILKGKDGKYYVLEINSMPNISNTKRSCGVRLAKHVSLWAEKQ